MGDEVLPSDDGTARVARTAAAGEVAAAVTALTGASQGQLATQARVLEVAHTNEEEGVGTMTAVLAAAAVSVVEEAAAAMAALAVATQAPSLKARDDSSLLFSLGEEEIRGLSLLDPDKTPVLPAGKGGAPSGGGDSGGGLGLDKEMVSASNTTDDHERVGDIDDPPLPLLGLE